MVDIPLNQVSNQELSIVLDEQNCTIKLYYRGNAFYMDLYIDGNIIFYGSICFNKVGIKIYPYLPFKGQLVFIDIDGNSDPEISGLDTRYILQYFSETEVSQYFSGGVYVR